MNGQELFGQVLKVTLINKASGFSSSRPTQSYSRGASGNGGRSASHKPGNDEPGEIGDFDDDSSITINSSGRAALMAKLGQDKDIFDPQPQQTKSSVVTPFLCLKNMFSPDDPDIG